MAVNAIYQAWEVNQQVTYYHCQFKIRAGTISTTVGEGQEGLAITASYTGAGDYLLTIATPPLLGTAIDILAVHVTPQVLGAAATMEGLTAVGIVSQSARTVQVLHCDDTSAPAAFADPPDGDGFFVTVVTRNSLAQQ